MVTKTFTLKYDEGDIVYLKTDMDQEPRIVIGWEYIGRTLRYIVMNGSRQCVHLPIELSRKKDAVLKTS